MRQKRDAREIPTRSVKALNETLPYWVGYRSHHDGNPLGGELSSASCCRTPCDQRVHVSGDEITGVLLKPLCIPFSISVLDHNIGAWLPSKITQAPLQRLSLKRRGL